MREMGFEGELLVSTAPPPETHKHWGIRTHVLQSLGVEFGARVQLGGGP
jgi:hypothetical protein